MLPSAPFCATDRWRVEQSPHRAYAVYALYQGSLISGSWMFGGDPSPDRSTRILMLMLFYLRVAQGKPSLTKKIGARLQVRWQLKRLCVKSLSLFWRECERTGCGCVSAHMKHAQDSCVTHRHTGACYTLVPFAVHTGLDTHNQANACTTVSLCSAEATRRSCRCSCLHKIAKLLTGSLLVAVNTRVLSQSPPAEIACQAQSSGWMSTILV